MTVASVAAVSVMVSIKEASVKIFSSGVLVETSGSGNNSGKDSSKLEVALISAIKDGVGFFSIGIWGTAISSAKTKLIILFQKEAGGDGAASSGGVSVSVLVASGEIISIRVLVDSEKLLSVNGSLSVFTAQENFNEALYGSMMTGGLRGRPLPKIGSPESYFMRVIFA